MIIKRHPWIYGTFEEGTFMARPATTSIIYGVNGQPLVSNEMLASRVAEMAVAMSDIETVGNA